METSDAPREVYDMISEAIEAWKAAGLVNMSPVWKGHPMGKYFAEVLSKRPESEKKLIELLVHENALVAAYSLIALEMMNSSVLKLLPEQLLERKQLITELQGSFGIEVELGEFALEIQNRWLGVHSRSLNERKD